MTDKELLIEELKEMQKYDSNWKGYKQFLKLEGTHAELKKKISKTKKKLKEIEMLERLSKAMKIPYEKLKEMYYKNSLI